MLFVTEKEPIRDEPTIVLLLLKKIEKQCEAGEKRESEIGLLGSGGRMFLTSLVYI